MVVALSLLGRSRVGHRLQEKCKLYTYDLQSELLVSPSITSIILLLQSPISPLQGV